MRVRSTFDPQISSSLLVNSCNLELGKSIGQGSFQLTIQDVIIIHVMSIYSGEFGIVYKSLLKISFQDPFSETVAVKTLKGKIIVMNIALWP